MKENSKLCYGWVMSQVLNKAKNDGERKQTMMQWHLQLNVEKAMRTAFVHKHVPFQNDWNNEIADGKLEEKAKKPNRNECINIKTVVHQELTPFNRKVVHFYGYSNYNMTWCQN